MIGVISMRKSILVGFIAATTMGLAIGAVAYAEGVWEPSEHAIAIRTTAPFKLELKKEKGTGIFECEFMAASKTAKAMESFTFVPVVIKCGTGIAIPKGSKWIAGTVHTNEAALRLPTNAMIVEAEAGCKVKIQESVIGTGGDFTPGELAKWEPAVSGTRVDIKEEPANCYNKATEEKEAELKLSANIVAAEGEEVKIK
jgi:hypothetical protein